MLPEKPALFRLDHAPGETEGDLVGQVLTQKPGVGGNLVEPHLVSPALKVEDTAAGIAENLLRVMGNCAACHLGILSLSVVDITFAQCGKKIMRSRSDRYVLREGECGESPIAE